MGGVVSEEAALAALREGKHHVLTEYVAKYERKSKVLDLSKQSLGVAGASAVAKGLQVRTTAIMRQRTVNSSLKTLGLAFNGIGDEGVKHIAAALKVNNTVQTLYLYDNNIGPDGAKAIGKALELMERCKC
eukprot:g68524.t1